MAEKRNKKIGVIGYGQIGSSPVRADRPGRVRRGAGGLHS